MDLVDLSKIFPAKVFNVTMYTIHDKPIVVDLPNFSPPIAYLATNRQKLTLPKFCTIRYTESLESNYKLK